MLEWIRCGRKGRSRARWFLLIRGDDRGGIRKNNDKRRRNLAWKKVDDMTISSCFRSPALVPCRGNPVLMLARQSVLLLWRLARAFQYLRRDDDGMDVNVDRRESKVLSGADVRTRSVSHHRPLPLGEQQQTPAGNLFCYRQAAERSHDRRDFCEIHLRPFLGNGER